MPAILGADLVGGLGGLGGERLDLGGNHGKAASGFACAGRFDGGVEREQVGLLGDCRNQLHHVADAGGGLRQFGDAGIGLLRLTHGLGGDAAGFLDLAADSRRKT
jgi:hypothetical protein